MALMPLRTVGDVDRRVQVVEEDADDLAEAERDDGEIVAAQLERGRAEQHAEAAGDQRPQRQHHIHRPVQAELRRTEQGVGVGAHGEERDVAQVEQARIADHDVEAQRQHDVEQGEIGDTHPAVTEQRVDDEGQRQQGNGEGEVAG